MKRKIGIFLLSALLVLSLSACGTVGDNDITGDNHTAADNGYHNDANGGSSTERSNRSTDTRRGVLEPDSGTNGTGANLSPAPGNNPGAGEGLTGRNNTEEGLFGTNGTSYEQMLRNGMVNDTDGDLTDGENSHS